MHFASDVNADAPFISYNSPEGYKMLSKTSEEYKYDFWKLSQYFVTEKGAAFCAIASIVMVLNSLKIVPTIPAPEHYPYKIFTQNNIFNNEKVLSQLITPCLY